MAVNHSREAATAVGCELANEILRSYGNVCLRAAGWSMLPSVWPGDTLVIEPATGDAVSEGDIVLFARNGRLVAHRIVLKSETEGLLHTRGDASRKPDAPITTHEILGKVSHIERAGKYVEPKKKLGVSERAMAALLHCSEIAPRVVVRMRRWRA